MSSSSEEYITATAEERERIREQRCIDYFKDKGGRAMRLRLLWLGRRASEESQTAYP